jgi:hypothetical protein
MVKRMENPIFSSRRTGYTVGFSAENKVDQEPAEGHGYEEGDVALGDEVFVQRGTRECVGDWSCWRFPAGAGGWAWI